MLVILITAMIHRGGWGNENMKPSKNIRIFLIILRNRRLKCGF